MTREEAIRHFERYVNNDCYTIEHRQACRMAIFALQNQPVWIPVTERLPGDAQFVLCFMRDEYLTPFRALRWSSADWRWDDGREWYYEQDVTHWMPLPEPPK